MSDDSIYRLTIRDSKDLVQQLKQALGEAETKVANRLSETLKEETSVEDNLDHKDAVLAQFSKGLDRCMKCGGELRVVQAREYPGASPWPYWYCANPDCIMFEKDQ